MSPLEQFVRVLPQMPLERIEKLKETLKEPLGGVWKSTTEEEVGRDFLSAIDSEIARRQSK